MRYQSIEMKNGEVWACYNGRGLFKRRKDGTWQQQLGNCQTPTFTAPTHMAQFIRKSFDTFSMNAADRHMKRNSAEGWK